METSKEQKEVLQAYLKSEKATINALKKIYIKARQDCAKKIVELSTRTDMENIQTIVYQEQYQKALIKQIDGILNILDSEQFTTIADYLQEAYENGYVGTMYDLKSQGIPITIPIDQKQVAEAIQTDSKISEGMYKRLGEDTKQLKQSIRQEISRGIVQGDSYNVIAERLANGMNNPFRKSYNNAIRIARTEGGRIQNQAALNAQQKAKKEGADILKQWNAALDGRTRTAHAKADGQIRELEEDFDVGGEKLKAPGIGGHAWNVCNCRCALSQRARWALDEDELNALKKRAEYFGLDKTKDFEEFKRKYLKLPENSNTMNVEPKSEAYKNILQQCKVNEIQYKQVDRLQHSLTTEQIINKISGHDLTGGSCVSLSMTYIANKNGLDVLDYRGGLSRSVFSSKYNNRQLASLTGVKGEIIDVKTELKGTMDILKTIDIGKEYMLNTGGHSSIIRRVSDKEYEYLELQSEIAERNGWASFDRFGSMSNTLIKRFGCRKTQRKTLGHKIQSNVMLLEVDSFKNCTEFEELLGYINTSESNQQKGVPTHVK